MKNMNFINLLELKNEIQGATYTIDDLIQILNNIFKILQRGGIAVLVLVLTFGFIYYGCADVDNKPRAKQRIFTVVYALIGVVLASTIVTIILSQFK